MTINTSVTSGTFNNLNQLQGLSPGGATRFQGILDKPGTVTVNGASAIMTSGTSFVANPPLATGTNTVTVAATDGSGNTRTNHYNVIVASGTGTRTLAYDADGNQTDNGSGQTYQWDAENRLAAINYNSGSITQSRFVYDGRGRRTAIIEMSGTTTLSTKQFVWYPGDAQPCEERDGSNAVTKRFYGQGEQIGAVNYFYTHDHLGSVREMTDSSGAIHARNDYDPYGRLTKVSGDLDSDFTYAGYYNHATSGMSLTLYRGYNPDLGRWLSPDPYVDQDGNDAEIALGPNLYPYVLNNPVNAVDLLGLNPFSPDSLSQSLYNAIARGSSQEIEGILDAAGDSLPEQAQSAGRAAVNRLRSQCSSLIRGSLKRSPSYHSELENETYEELLKDSSKAAKQMRKLIEQSARLLEKNK